LTPTSNNSPLAVTSSAGTVYLEPSDSTISV